jgi:hypothetical protein
MHMSEIDVLYLWKGFFLPKACVYFYGDSVFQVFNENNTSQWHNHFSSNLKITDYIFRNPSYKKQKEIETPGIPV